MFKVKVSFHRLEVSSFRDSGARLMWLQGSTCNPISINLILQRDLTSHGLFTGGYVGDYIGDYQTLNPVCKGDTRSLD